jgi:predicted TIM-barrel fold metal-dependent hydrolase
LLGAAGLAESATYRGPIIDTHVHFYDPTRPQGVPWPPKNDALLYKRVLPADFREVTKGLGVTGVVIVEASGWLEDNQWVLDLAKDDPMILGIVGHIDPATPDFRSNLARFAKHRLFKGLRIGGASVAGALANPTYLADLAALADADLQLDVLGDKSMFTPLLQLSDKLPKLRMSLITYRTIRPCLLNFGGVPTYMQRSRASFARLATPFRMRWRLIAKCWTNCGRCSRKTG